MRSVGRCHRKRPCPWCTPTETDRNEAGKRCFYRDCSQERPRPELGLFPGLEVFNPNKPDHVFLEAAPGFRSNALLLCAYGNPTIFTHPVKNGGSRKKTIPFRNAFDGLESENTRSKTAHFIIRDCDRSRDGCLCGTHVSRFG